MSYVIDLSDPRAEQVSLCGGKGAGLAKLKRAGFAVPDGIVVTTEAYRAVLAGLPGFAERAQCLPDAPDALQVAAERLRAELLHCALPSGLVGELAASLDDGEFAVRSSATLEDLASASFAGQHDTFLGRSGLPSLLDALRACLASFWQDRAVAYRRRLGLGDDAASSMAVVIQRMVVARAAGVAFTLDPVLGRLDEIHVSAQPGLGEGVVNGESDVDRFVFAKRDLILRHSVGPSAVLCLSAEQATAVADAARAIEAWAGFPQDVEWAIDDTGVRVLQARAVTAIPARWTRDESAERFPNVVTPLAWDFAEAGFHEALTASFARMGLPPLRAKWFARFDGYVYGNQNAVDLYLGQPLIASASIEALRAALPGLLRRFAWIDELPAEWAVTLDRFLMEVGQLGATPLDRLSRREIWAHVQAINQVGRAYFRHNIAISIGQAAVHRGLRALLGILLPADRVQAAYDVLVAPAETRTAGINRQLDLLAELAGEPDLGAMLERGAPRELLSSGALNAFPSFLEAFQALLREHGHRELDFDPYHAGWGEAPWFALDAVRARLGQATATRSAFGARQAASVLEGQLASGIPGEMAALLHELVRLARLYTELDDNEHYQTARLGPLLRRAVMALGRGVTDDPLDLFFATEAALAAAVIDDTPQRWTALAGTIATSRQEYRAQQASAPRWVLADEAKDVPDEGDMAGVPGSPGRAEGRAFIVRSPADFAACPAGAILIVRATTPAWTALFARASGIVAESGGPLSHGAIAAREQGIPAVMAVRGAMERIRNGQRLALDGTKGRVAIRD